MAATSTIAVTTWTVMGTQPCIRELPLSSNCAAADGHCDLSLTILERI
jgi:hypothetical protein